MVLLQKQLPSEILTIKKNIYSIMPSSLRILIIHCCNNIFGIFIALNASHCLFGICKKQQSSVFISIIQDDT